MAEHSRRNYLQVVLLRGGQLGAVTGEVATVGGQEEPEQTVRVLPSTAGQATWVVAPAGCPPDIANTSASSSCSQSRGGLFNASQSTSWDGLGNYTLGLNANLGYGDLSALYGLDTITLGFGDSIGGPTLDSQVVTALAPRYYYIGLFGLNHQATNLSDFTDPHPSFLKTMKMKNLIPNLKGVFGSLTFGGYDLSRFVPNNVSLSLAPDVTRDLVVGLQSITSTTANHSTTSLLPSPILTFIDSSQPQIYLPIESCQAFENAFGLVWNQTDEMYWVDDNLHQILLTTNPNITFAIGNSLTGGPTVDIVLPYASFDLQRADNESQYTLGRTFLQEAYVITDYERSNFSVSQAKFDDGIPENIITIRSTTAMPGHISQKAIIGTRVGATVFVLLVVIALALFVYNLRRKSNKQIDADLPEASTLSQERKISISCSVREIGNNSTVGPIRELPDSGKAELLDEQSPSGSGNEISEMSEAHPVVHELRTHRSSMEQFMIQANSTSTCKIFVSTKILRKSAFGVDSTDGTRYVETMISASAQQSMIRSSTDTSNLEKIYESRSRASVFVLSTDEFGIRDSTWAVGLGSIWDVDRVRERTDSENLLDLVQDMAELAHK
ncbi:MAG: hypothetical protein Q9217_002835 [Psora testacea]